MGQSFSNFMLEPPNLLGQNIGEALRAGGDRYQFPQVTTCSFKKKKYIKLL